MNFSIIIMIMIIILFNFIKIDSMSVNFQKSSAMVSIIVKWGFGLKEGGSILTCRFTITRLSDFSPFYYIMLKLVSNF